ncbi:MBL fold metallo-hydrolase, partial [Polaribacter sp. BAL334]|uniref:MBL fold metallo-hydrolase n=1 Tax=Polaribacter sp. BAL334 TaxID=1708178 RepID=UPI0018D2404F
GLEYNFFYPPLADEIEISLIGTGGGYGESVIVKLNLSEWAIIDSCINPNSGKSLPLEYLEKIGVDYKTQVKFVICTHWHNDHILGISEVLKKCEMAKFCMPDVHNRDKFLLLVALDSKKDKLGSI